MRLTVSQCKDFFKAIGLAVLDTLFPLRCLGCGTKGTWICPPCQHRIIYRTEQECPACRKRITPSGEICFSCRDTSSSSLEGIFVAAEYHDPLLSRALHTYKYRFIRALASPLGICLETAIERSSLLLPDALIAVPLHPRRLRFRGFNQSELLAEKVGELLTPGMTLPVLSGVLKRCRYTTPQMKMSSRTERLTNLKNAFTIPPPHESAIFGKNLWLIDDVATTGTTLEACARVLKRAGAKSVFGIVLAR